MGFTINDSFTLKSGLTVTGVYASLSGQPINIIKSTPYNDPCSVNDWVAISNYNIWANKDSADNNLPFLQQEFIKTIIDPAKPVFSSLYATMKAKYISTTDC